ncbi:MAG: hypothetical protein LW817_08370 [Candidatus Caenarcaniphilales bacterium]|jgi:hypothetical protein|nr:hypothetical protein [Candidatus Caenarcaniphilales bacterium]
MKRLILSGITTVLIAGSAYAYYPATVFKFKNCKIRPRQVENLEDSFLKYLEDHQAILTAKNKKYKVDQLASFDFELDEKGNIDFNSTKVNKNKKSTNIDFNLQSLDFLRSQKLKLEKKSEDKAITVLVKYLAF